MSEGERPARRRVVVSHWRSTALTVVGAGGAGFGAAVLSGVDTAFSQPLATLLAGTGVLTAGILTYINGQRSREQAEEHHGEDLARERERHTGDTERAREAALWERFGAAAAQLADKSAAIRIAGVYAMAGVADERSGSNRQQCIDVLCGYLRLPYDTEQGGSGRTKLVTKTSGADGAEQEEHTEYRQNDREVRATILRVIADHLRPTAECSWSTSDFDFRTAHLEDVDLTDATFSGTARFSEVTFSGDARFNRATFSSDAWFDRATFSGKAVFDGTTFSSDARFDEVTFSGRGDTLSDGVRFERVTFSGDAWFDRAVFPGHAWFGGVTFSGITTFIGATFSGEAAFSIFTGQPGFTASTAEFDGATFSGKVRFDEATFSRGAKFNGATFSGTIVFWRVDFGTKVITFANPKQWGPPAPKFDWDQDISQKPANIEPQDWPPVVAAAS